MTASTPAIAELLLGADLTVESRIAESSNATFRCILDDGPHRCAYKPRSGERPLWDFPQGTLGHREVATYALAELAAWPVVPTTVWREDGPFGPGMCQLWIEENPTHPVVDIIPAELSRDGWLSVLEGEDGSGHAVRLVHRQAWQLQQVALLDAVANNADRKGGHLLVDAAQRVWAIDHGVCFAADPKLRTVLWGWAGRPIPEEGMAQLERLLALLPDDAGEPVTRWLNADERSALVNRVRHLLASGRFPLPHPDWPAIPWPVM